MKNLSLLLKTHWPQVLLLACSLFGFVDATYLTVSHYTNFQLPCAIFTGCETVTNSAYSVMGGVPVALLGVLFYLFIILAVVSHLLYRHRYIPYLLVYVSFAAFLFSLYFLSLQIWVINAICFYCVMSAITSTIIFATSIYFRFHRLP